MSQEVHPEEGIYDVRLGYNSKLEGYATLVSGISKLDAIFWRNLNKE